MENIEIITDVAYVNGTERQSGVVSSTSGRAPTPDSSFGSAMEGSLPTILDGGSTGEQGGPLAGGVDDSVEAVPGAE
eukprot:COSAG02_NODE_8095_length_2712_cov_2.393418_3_plen_77_part_00